MDKVRPENTMSDAKVGQMSTFLRQKRLNWYRHIRRREEDPTRKMMDMVIPGKKRGGAA